MEGSAGNRARLAGSIELGAMDKWIDAHLCHGVNRHNMGCM